MADEKEFVDGLIAKKPSEKAPDFVKVSLSIKRKELGNWLRGKEDDWINVDIKESKGGNYYAEVNSWKPDNKSEREPGSDDDAPY